MDNAGVADTIAYRIVDQIFGHIFPDEKFSESDFMKIYRGYIKIGGSWESLVHGELDSFNKMMGILKAFVKIRKHPKKYGIK